MGLFEMYYLTMVYWFLCQQYRFNATRARGKKCSIDQRNKTADGMWPSFAIHNF